MRQHLAQTWQSTPDGNDAIVIWRGRNGQRVRVERVRAFNEYWLLFLTPIVHEKHVSQPRDALVFNSRLAFGALAIEQQYLMLRAACPLATLLAARLDEQVEFLAREGRRLRALHVTLSGRNPRHPSYCE